MLCNGRKILVFLDRCAAHPKQVDLKNVSVEFLPTNTTCRLHSLDASIIRNVKCHFKGLLVRRLLAKIDRQDEELWISLVDALHFLLVSWAHVTVSTIANCFRKCGYVNPYSSCSS